MLEDLFVEIEKSHTFELTSNPSEIDEFEKQCGYKLPEDLKEFYRRYRTVNLFDSEDGGVYRFLAVNEMESMGYDFYGNMSKTVGFLWLQACFTICGVLDGKYIVVDLSSRNGSECNFIDCFNVGFWKPGESQVIAKSFRELLEQSLKGGSQLFCLKEDFKGYGNALEITPETAIFRVSNDRDLTKDGWLVDFVCNKKSFINFFADKDYGGKEKSYDVAKQFIEENKR